MPYMNTQYRGRLGSIHEYPVATSETFGLTFSQAFADNPVTKAYDLYETVTAGGRRLNDKDIEQRMQEAGVSFDINVPVITEGGLDILIDRAQDRQKQQQTLDAIPPSTTKTLLSIGGSLAGSSLDFLNVATAFIPVYGQARTATMLAKAAGPVGRAAVRARIGAVEGVVGAAVIEPLSYNLSQILGDDYTSLDSLMNIGFGGLLGAGLHMGAGALGDAFSKGKNLQLAKPVGETGRQMMELTPEDRMTQAKAALAQAVTDQKIDVDDIVNFNLRQVPPEKRLVGVRQDLKRAEEQLAEVDLSLKDETIMAFDRLGELENLLKNPELGLKVRQELGVEDLFLREQYAKEINNKSFRKELAARKEKLLNKKENISKRKLNVEKQIENFYTQFETDKLSNPDTPTQVNGILNRVASGQQNSRKFNDNLIREQDAVLEKAPKNEDLTTAEQELKIQEDSLRAWTEQYGEDADAILAEANEEITFVVDNEKALKSMAVCLTRKGI